MAYTLGQAAKAADVSKTTIQRAIKSGRLSASRQDDGSYVIDPAELHRVFPGVHRDGNGDGEMASFVTPHDTGGLRVEIEMLRERVAALEADKDDLRRRLDESETERRQTQERLTALLTDQRPPEPRKGFWRRLRGR
jgi:hypothetical protein